MRRLLALLLFLPLPLKAQCESEALRLAEGLIVAGLAYELIDNGFSRLSGAADKLEDSMPSVLHYNRWGDPVTWVHHAAWTASAGLAGGAVAKAVGAPFRCGFDHFSKIAVGFYVVRETVGAFRPKDEGLGAFRDERTHPDWRRGTHTGWLCDGLGDVLGPFAVRLFVRVAT